MGLKSKINIIQQKQDAEKRLASRIELLKSRETPNADIRKDGFVKKVQADIRQANRRLKQIANLEEREAKAAEAKAAPKEEKPKAETQPEPSDGPSKKQQKKAKKAKAKTVEAAD